MQPVATWYQFIIVKFQPYIDYGPGNASSRECHAVAFRYIGVRAGCVIAFLSWNLGGFA